MLRRVPPLVTFRFGLPAIIARTVAIDHDSPCQRTVPEGGDTDSMQVVKAAARPTCARPTTLKEALRMPVLLKIRTDSSAADFLSMKDEGPAVGERSPWGVIGRHADYRSAGDVKFLRDGELSVGDLVLVRERQSAKNVYFVGLLKVVSLGEGVDEWEPEYEMIERFDGSATVDRLRATTPALSSLPHFQKNAKGFMLRSFTPLTPRELDMILSAVRKSMKQR